MPLIEYNSIKDLEYYDGMAIYLTMKLGVIYKCESCNKYYIQMQKFCSDCGGDKLKVYRIVRICKKCKISLKDQKFCPECGQKTE